MKTSKDYCACGEHLYCLTESDIEGVCIRCVYEQSKARVNELLKLTQHSNGKILLGWMDAHRKAMDRVEELEAENNFFKRRLVSAEELIDNLEKISDRLLKLV